MNVYFISGLAADCRVFTHVELPQGFQKCFINWIDPLPGESLSAYAIRLAGAIDTTQPFVIAGLSMGGMMATEIANHYHAAACLLLCSVPSYQHLPPYYALARRAGLHKIVPIGLLKQVSMLKRDFTPDTKADKILLRQIVADSDPRFIRWAMGAVLQWKNEKIPSQLWQIHGSKDGILPMRYTRPTHILQGGNHLMIMSRAAEINQFFAEVLPALQPAVSISAPG